MEKEMVKKEWSQMGICCSYCNSGNLRKKWIDFVQVKFHSNENIEMALHTTSIDFY
jgi:hypothetical protein